MKIAVSVMGVTCRKFLTGILTVCFTTGPVIAIDADPSLICLGSGLMYAKRNRTNLP